MKSARIGIVVSMTVVGLAFAIWIIESLPGIPYNLQELVADHNPVIQAVQLSCTLYALFGIPVMLARLAQRSSRVILSLPFLLLAQTALVWLFLRSAVPVESIHDILGSPILDWPWEWEYLFRLSGMVLLSGSMLTGACILTAISLRTEGADQYRTFVHWIIMIVPLLVISHWIIVEQAATDNLTELMAGGGNWRAMLFIAMWMASTGLAGSLVSARLATGRPTILFVTILALLSLPAAYAFLRFGLEQEVHKYKQIFSALQFLLSANRANLAGGLDLLVRFLVFHYGLVALIAVFQYPFWVQRPAPKSAGRPRHVQKTRDRVSGFPPALAAPLAYGCLVIYGTLYPFDAWQVQDYGTFASVLTAWPEHISLADVFSNAIVYLPFGFLLAVPLRQRFAALPCIGLVTAAGFLLSWTLEYLQYSIPFRNTSSLDLVLNLLGTAAGAVVALLTRPQHALGNRLRVLRNAWFQAGPGTDIALAAIGLWILASTFPFVPSIDIGSLRHSIAPLWVALHNPSSVSLQLIASHTLSFFGIGQLAMLAALSASRIRDAYVGLLTLVVFLSIPLMERSLDAERLLALIAAVLLLYTLGTGKSKRGSLLASTAIITAYITQNLYMPAAVAGTQTATFNWVPFAGQMGNVTRGLADILENSWPFAALAYLAWNWLGGRYHRTPVTGAALVFLGVLAINLLQQLIPGRYPDITDAIVATTAWLIAWRLLRYRTTPRASKQTPEFTQNAFGPLLKRYETALLVTCTLLTLPFASLLLGAIVSPHTASKSPAYQLPEPKDLPPAPLTQFHLEHPRLPAPTAEEIATLRSQNPAYLRQLSRRAKGGRGKADAIVTMAYIEPGSQDLGTLLDRLLTVEFSKRASGEVKEVALAYDWLYSQWNPVQQAQLRSKVADGCEHLIRFIREENLSPYNVILYNTLLQDLVACSVALYGDDKHGDPVMAFTYDLLKSRVLPVWRQVMGQHGGWHEGGEYVAIGIGRAIYQVPAMWRKATGEDLFADEPGIRGFLDFLVYRTRPDGTQFRWGDGAFFDRSVPDRIPLAIEYRHAAAYSLNGCPDRMKPTSWPWGPLPDNSLCDPDAVEHLPLTAVFDGIGMLVTRNDWSDDATYITYKAGDNYWSHSHLDQGSFTIYKGGPLAIDSGAYGGGGNYGSEHHMNYAYQTIAHNSITVTDTADSVPAPAEDKSPRKIANDGGQRRIGSGWGINAAPIDIQEWNEQRETYHTGEIEKLLASDGLVVVASDITPAYTNSHSGKGTFTDRTQRVERLWRTFGYDSVDDVVVIFDQLKSTQPEFRKRWLLHSIEAPALTDNGFLVTIAPEAGKGRSGGRLEGHVLLPEDPLVKIVGGSGAAFLVDGTNYDENGALEKYLQKRKKTEAGEWRIEISPPDDSQDVLYLVVMLPSPADSAPPHRISRLREGGRIGCEIRGPGHTTRWWFTPGRNGLDVEITTASGATIRHPVWADTSG